MQLQPSQSEPAHAAPQTALPESADPERPCWRGPTGGRGVTCWVGARGARVGCKLIFNDMQVGLVGKERYNYQETDQ